MILLKPEDLFARLAKNFPEDCLEHVFVVGSLAAAYHFRGELYKRGVTTKDADLVVFPAGDTESCQAMAERLLEAGWVKHPECYGKETQDPVEELRVIRLNPPDSNEYFIEFLNLPEVGQEEAKKWIPVQVQGSWYGLPTFRFLGLSAEGRLLSEQGIWYAAPAMMALANLLSHPTVRPEYMSQPIDGRKILRSAKDLGRILALAFLSGREEAETWIEPWTQAMSEWFPESWPDLAAASGNGFRELLENGEVLDQAWHTCNIGLLQGKAATQDNLKATGERLLGDLIEPFETAGREAREKPL